MAEKRFSVVAEFADGTTKILPVQGESSSDAFRQVRDTPGVRRVGRVTEMTSSDRRENGSAESQGYRVPNAEPHTTPRESRSWIDHVISGPRTVVYAPSKGGEQPFKHLKAPPERPKAAFVPAPVSRVPEKVAPPVSRTNTAKADSAPTSTAVASPLEYRIMKSRRRDGLPFLLQRGRWQEMSGKRTLNVEWEKSFEDREKAEKHLNWVLQTERELVELEQSA